MDVELFECPNYFVVNIKWQFLIELEWSNPGYVLTHYFYLVVNALNTEK